MQTKLLFILVSLLAVALLGASFFSEELRGLTGGRKLRIPEESVSDFSEEQLETKEIYKYDETYATKECGYAEISYEEEKVIRSWSLEKTKRFPKPIDIEVFYNRKTDMFGFMAYDEVSDTIKIAFRGTRRRSLINWMHNINFIKEPL